MLQAAIKARAWAMEEHRAQDETGGNGRDITRAFDRALADVGISTQGTIPPQGGTARGS